MVATDSNHTASQDTYTVIVNDRSFRFPDSVLEPRRILNTADFAPADECILVQVFGHGTRAIGLDETVDLTESGAAVFRAFHSDRVYRFTVDERGFDWGDPKIKEPVLRAIAHVPESDVIVFERKDHPDRELGPQDDVDLASGGTEHLRTKRSLVKVFFKDDPYCIPAGTYTTEELMAQFPIEEGYLLNLKTEDGELVTLKPGQKLHVEEGMHFYSQPPGGGSS
jgi:hypothetical protein